jgi:hypothetical protein
MGYSRPKPPSEAGTWTLLQSRLDRSFWQWDREAGTNLVSQFVILRGPDRYDYDTFDEAEALFEALEETTPILRPVLPLSFEAL